MPEEQMIETDVPARMDRLPWSGWHRKIIVALGTSWMLDGLQVTLAGSLAGILEDKRTLGFSDPQVAEGATAYLAGAVTGAILFGYLTDRLGRRKLFLVTLSIYSLATAATALAWNFPSFALFRFHYRSRDRRRVRRYQLGGGRTDTRQSERHCRPGCQRDFLGRRHSRKRGLDAAYEWKPSSHKPRLAVGV